MICLIYPDVISVKVSHVWVAGGSLCQQNWGMKGWAFEEHMIMFLSGGPSQILARTIANDSCLTYCGCIHACMYTYLKYRDLKSIKHIFVCHCVIIYCKYLALCSSRSSAVHKKEASDSTSPHKLRCSSQLVGNLFLPKRSQRQFPRWFSLE